MKQRLKISLKNRVFQNIYFDIHKHYHIYSLSLSFKCNQHFVYMIIYEIIFHCLQTN